jgi:hypothetical protein
MDLVFSTLIVDDDYEYSDSLIQKLDDYLSELGLKHIGKSLYNNEHIFSDLKQIELNKYNLILIDLNFGTQEQIGNDHKGEEYIKYIRSVCDYVPIIFYTGNRSEVDILELNKFEGIYHCSRNELREKSKGFIDNYSNNLIIKNTFRNYGCYFEYCTHNFLSKKTGVFNRDKWIYFRNKINKKLIKKSKNMNKVYDQIIGKEYGYSDIKSNSLVFDHSITVRMIKYVNDILGASSEIDFETYQREVINFRNDFSHNNYVSQKDSDADYKLNSLNRNINISDIINFRKNLLKYYDLFTKLMSN